MAQVEFLLPVGSLYNESEFNAGSGACGPAAVAVGARWAAGARKPLAKDIMLAMQQMTGSDGKPLAGPTGVTTLGKMRVACGNLHLTTQTQVGAPLEYAASVFQAKNGLRAGVTPLGVSNGQALRDYLTGLGEDATNLQNHFFALVGYHAGGYSNFLGCNVPAGFFACDGAHLVNNPVVAGSRIHRYINTSLIFYPLTVLNAAAPFGAFSILKTATP